MTQRDFHAQNRAVSVVHGLNSAFAEDKWPDDDVKLSGNLL
jgi:hypothetical protein